MLSLPLDSYASTSAVTLEALAALAVHVASDQTQVVLGVGAGISTAAGIPDFRGGCGSVYGASPPRSPTRAHSTNTDPRPTLTRSARRTKQLFHYDAILRPDSRAEHFQLMVELRKAAKRAVKDGKRRQQEDCAPIVEGVNSSSEPVPTAFHGLMKGLADRGRLARVYTQNIDGLEAATGLLSLATTPADTPSNRPSTPRLTRSRTSGGGRVNVTTDTPHRHQFSAPDLVVALHGSLDHVSCSVCHHTTEWKKRHTIAFKNGRAKKCPICYGRAQSRKLESKRAINPSQLAFLRPAIVLYDDPSFASSSAASHISSIADADLAAGPTCLIVAGTSLRIPGFRSLVKDFSKAVRQQGGFCVLVNREAVSKEWNAVFDYHFLGDTEVFAQHFTNLLDAFLPSSTPPSTPPPPKSSPSPLNTAQTSSSTESPPLLHSLTTLEPISRISLPPTPPPSSSPLLKPAKDLPALDPSPARPSPKRAASTQPLCYPRPKKRQRPAEAGAQSPIVAQEKKKTKEEEEEEEEEEKELQLVPDSDHERAAEAYYLSPPPSSLPDPTSRTNELIAPVDHAAATAAVATTQMVSSPPEEEEGPGKKEKKRRPKKVRESRLEQFSVAEILRRAEKLERKARREARRFDLLRKEEKRSKKRERRRREEEKKRQLSLAKLGN
ncbi:hypothetical protein JCM8115_001110 [Rhodotorula mucilaginosa]